MTIFDFSEGYHSREHWPQRNQVTDLRDLILNYFIRKIISKIDEHVIHQSGKVDGNSCRFKNACLKLKHCQIYLAILNLLTGQYWNHHKEFVKRLLILFIISVLSLMEIFSALLTYLRWMNKHSMWPSILMSYTTLTFSTFQLSWITVTVR